MAKEQFNWKRLIAIFGIGFISILLIIFFIGADLFQFFGGSRDPNTIAVVNGEKIHRFDFLNYMRKLPSYFQNEKMQDFAFNRFIQDIMLLQKAEKEGFSVSEDRLVQDINEYVDQSREAILTNPRGDYSFQQSVKKWDNPRMLKEILKFERKTLTKFTNDRRNELIRMDFMRYIMMGSAVSTADLRSEYIIQNSNIQIQYAQVANSELRKRFSNRITVSEDEVTAEMNRNKEEIKDPETDRKRIKKKLEKEKLKALKDKLVDSINGLSEQGGSFARAAGILKGRISVSTPGKIGQPLLDANNSRLSLKDLTSSKTYLESFLVLNKGQTSKVIETTSNLYIFTPLIKNVPEEAPEISELQQIENRLREQSFNMMYSNLMRKLSEESQVIKNLKDE